MPQEFIFVLAMFSAMAAVLAILRRFRRSASGRTANYRKIPNLLTPAERSFFGALEQATKDRFRIMAKVRLADAIRPEKELGRSRATAAFNRISRKHLDFVLCDPDTLEIRAAVELDDASHRRADRRLRDDFLDRALESAGIPLHRFPARTGYDVAAIRKALEPEKRSAAATDVSRDSSGSRVCPRCGAELVERVSKKGKYAGQRFLGCANYPACRMLIPLKTDGTKSG